MDATPLLEIKGLTKIFPGVVALNQVDLTIQKGEIHVLLGENGAGKSTLIKSIMGIETPNEGTFLWDGAPFQNHCVADAHRMGIATIYQELSNIPCLSVVENMFVGNELPKKGYKHIIDWKKQRELAKTYLKKVGCAVSPDAICETLGMGQKQLVEIAKALMHNARLIIMDEPTSSLSRKEIDDLLVLMRELKREGVSILFITHKLDEAQHVGDVVSILKDGQRVGKTMPMAEVDEREIVRMMVGRDLTVKYPPRNAAIGDVILTVEGLSGKGFENINFDLRRGELLGIFGLIGAGRTEAMRAIFGADPKSEGKIVLNGKPLHTDQHDNDGDPNACGAAVKLHFFLVVFHVDSLLNFVACYCSALRAAVILAAALSRSEVALAKEKRMLQALSSPYALPGMPTTPAFSSKYSHICSLVIFLISK